MENKARRNFLKFSLGVAALPVMARVATAAGHATLTVEIQNGRFNPATLEMQAGDKVTFINLDGAPHTATADDGSFDTGRLRRGQDATITVSAAGTHSYFCAVHPRMKGRIVAS
ncbi:MAG: cupredoxin family copper-binding protein [Pseudomonadota bacterium]